jgi:hypothetical protein
MKIGLLVLIFLFALVPLTSSASLNNSEISDKLISIEKIITTMDTDNKNLQTSIQNLKESIPTSTLHVFGTEYQVGDNAKIWLQLLTTNSTPILNATCFTDVYTPDNLISLERATMTNFNHDGIYYYDLPILTSATLGVYPVLALCYFQATEILNFASNYFIEYGTYSAGSISDTFIIDTANFLRFKETSVGTRNISVGFNFTVPKICANISESLLTGITIRTHAKFDSVLNDDVTISFYNYTSGNWQELFNKILEGADFRDVSNSFVLDNISGTGFVDETGSNIKIRYNDVGNLTDGSTSNLDIDYVSFSCDSLINPVFQEVRGASEMHVTYRNETRIAEEVWNYTGTINSNLLTQIGNAIWNIFYITNDFINQTSNNIWTATDRNLTYYPTPSTLTASEVWDYTNRNLTYYPPYPSFNITINGTDIATQVWGYNGVISNNILTQIANKVLCSLKTWWSEISGNKDWGVDIC